LENNLGQAISPLGLLIFPLWVQVKQIYKFTKMNFMIIYLLKYINLTSILNLKDLAVFLNKIKYLFIILRKHFWGGEKLMKIREDERGRKDNYLNLVKNKAN